MLGRPRPCRIRESESRRGSPRRASAAPHSAAAPLRLHPRQRSHAAVGLASLHPQLEQPPRRKFPTDVSKKVHPPYSPGTRWVLLPTGTCRSLRDSLHLRPLVRSDRAAPDPRLRLPRRLGARRRPVQLAATKQETNEETREEELERRRKTAAPVPAMEAMTREELAPARPRQPKEVLEVWSSGSERAPVTAGSSGPRTAARSRTAAMPEPTSKRRSGMSPCGIRSPTTWRSSPSGSEPSRERTSEPPAAPVATCRETILAARQVPLQS